MGLLEKCRNALRLDDDNLDDDIQDMINACKKDLNTSGVEIIEDDDPLVISATKTYCRAHFDVTNPDHEKYIASYESLKIHMALCGDYKKVTI